MSTLCVTQIIACVIVILDVNRNLSGVPAFELLATDQFGASCNVLHRIAMVVAGGGPCTQEAFRLSCRRHVLRTEAWFESLQLRLHDEPKSLCKIVCSTVCN
eukprot:COSAG02_NODE_283_length_25709_cov_24.523311_15_plen_102_part_00